jgi:hypothetical protein
LLLPQEPLEVLRIEKGSEDLNGYRPAEGRLSATVDDTKSTVPNLDRIFESGRG